MIKRQGISRFRVKKLSLLATALLATSLALAQQNPQIDFRSVGRGAPLLVEIPGSLQVDPTHREDFPAAEIDGLGERYWLVGPHSAAGRSMDGQTPGRRIGSAFKAVSTAQPSMPGIITSNTMTDGSSCRASSSRWSGPAR